MNSIERLRVLNKNSITVDLNDKIIEMLAKPFPACDLFTTYCTKSLIDLLNEFDFSMKQYCLASTHLIELLWVLFLLQKTVQSCPWLYAIIMNIDKGISLKCMLKHKNMTFYNN